jgi:hypothetical protein
MPTLELNQKTADGQATAPALVVTDENVEECERRFKSLPRFSPEWDALGDALHVYILG